MLENLVEFNPIEVQSFVITDSFIKNDSLIRVKENKEKELKNFCKNKSITRETLDALIKVVYVESLENGLEKEMPTKVWRSYMLKYLWPLLIVTIGLIYVHFFVNEQLLGDIPKYVFYGVVLIDAFALFVWFAMSSIIKLALNNSELAKPNNNFNRVKTIFFLHVEDLIQRLNEGVFEENTFAEFYNNFLALYPVNNKKQKFYLTEDDLEIFRKIDKLNMKNKSEKNLAK